VRDGRSAEKVKKVESGGGRQTTVTGSCGPWSLELFQDLPEFKGQRT
jgi:hypothetical protein